MLSQVFRRWLLATATPLACATIVAEPASKQGFQFPSQLVSLDVTSNAGITDNEIANGIQWAGGGNRIILRIQEKNPDTEAWEKTAFTYSVPYSVTAVSARRAGKFVFVAGAYSNGDAVVERWVFPTVTGSFFAVVEPPETPVGVDRDPFAVNLSIKGGTYISHASRYAQASGGGVGISSQPIPQKTEMYRGSAYGLFGSIAVDPEGRFLLLHSFDNHNLYSVNVTGPPFTFQVLYTPSQIPHLTNVTNMQLLDHWTSNNRFVLLSQLEGSSVPLGAQRTVIFDYDNDGQFDGFQTLSPTQWASSPFADSDEWRSPLRLDN